MASLTTFDKHAICYLAILLLLEMTPLFNKNLSKTEMQKASTQAN